MALLTGAPRSATLIAVTSCLCLYLSAEKFRRFLPFAPELMDDLIFTAKCRRRKSIEINAEASLQIPDIDGDIDNKLYLYSLLRSKEADELQMSNGSGQAAANEVKSLKEMNRQAKALNETKRQRVRELKERVSTMLKHVVPENFDIKDKSPLSPISEATTQKFPSTRILQRRNSWTSNTDIEQHKLDLANILKASSKQQLDTMKPLIEHAKTVECAGRRGRQVTGTINIDIEVEEIGKASPTVALGKHFETFSAAAHQLEEEFNGNEVNDSRPSSRGSSRSFRSSAGSILSLINSK